MLEFLQKDSSAGKMPSFLLKSTLPKIPELPQELRTVYQKNESTGVKDTFSRDDYFLQHNKMPAASLAAVEQGSLCFPASRHVTL